MPDFILNGQAHGDVAAILMQSGGDPSALRPYVGDDGRSYVTINQNGKPVAVPTNNTAHLRYDDWKQIDEIVLKAARQRLRITADLYGAGLSYSIPNGLGKTVLQTEKMSDPGTATRSMDGIRRGQQDRPVFDIENLPLPITHSDFGFSMRQVMASRNGGSPLDTTMAEAAGRRVAESIEELVLGTVDEYVYGGGSVYGITNFPSRLTHSMTLPTGGGWSPADTVDEVLAMRQKLANARHYGPYVLYTSLPWDAHLDADYTTSTATNMTLRERLAKIDSISAIRTLDYLPNYQMLLIEMNTMSIRMVNGMDITTVQWMSGDNLWMNYKVMTIQVPQLRADINGRTGILHATAS